MEVAVGKASSANVVALVGAGAAAVTVSMVVVVVVMGGAVEQHSQDQPAKHTLPPSVALKVDISKSLHTTSPKFLSLTISGGRMRRNLPGFDFSSQRLKNMAAALAPANVRFGGTHFDFLQFVPKGKSALRFKRAEKPKKDLQNFTLSGARWDTISQFVADAGWDIIWAFNVLHWTKDQWNPSFAREFLEYCEVRGIEIASFQLGNEPNLYPNKFGIVIDGDQMAENFNTVKELTSEFPTYENSSLLGPDTSNLHHSNGARKYTRKFLESGGCVTVKELALHHYYMKGEEAKLKYFLDPKVMDNLQELLDYSHEITESTCKDGKPICFTETSSASGGFEGVSNAYAAGFLWLDKLGISAKNRVTFVCRQTFYGSNYALIRLNHNPNPDFYLSVLFKRLIEGPVFNVDTTQVPERLRLYAHCVRKGYYDYPDGALAVYYLNTADTQTYLALDQYKDQEVHVFAFTPGDKHGLNSREMSLNGQTLVIEGATLPKMDPKTHKGDVPLEQRTYGFIVIPDAEVKLCKTFHQAAAETM